MIDDSRVSSQHAALRWTGEFWEMRDLGSRNGTRICETALAAGHGYRLPKDAAVAFGGLDPDWSLVDDSPPQVMALQVDGARSSTVDGEILGIPSNDDPVATIYQASDGQWRLERPDGTLIVIGNRQIFDVGENQWRFSCPEVVSSTDMGEHPRRGISQMQLELRVSRDEEHVEMTIDLGGQRMELGSRTHNYLLVVLGRHRLEDRARGIPEGACGWIYVDDLIQKLASSAAQLNIDIFRIRRQFGTIAHLSDAARVIERRPRTKQLRIGVSQLVLSTL